MVLKDKVNTAKDVLSNTRSRMVIVLLAILMAVVLVVAYVKFKRSEVPPAGRGSAMTGVPAITSIPGVGEPTREYAKLQEQQNIELAEEAARRGTAAIPTVVRTTYLEAGASADLIKGAGATSAEGCDIDSLKRARASGVTASELRCRGCSLASLRAAGFTAGELKAAGFSAAELKEAGFSAAELKNAGFSAKELAQAGFSEQDLSNAGFTDGELKGADKACSPRKIQEARSRGVKASELRKLGCSAAALRAAGYTAAELKIAGFSAGELMAAGFSTKELKEAGFSATELRNAGFSADMLAEAGFTADELSEAGFTPGDLVRAGVIAGEVSSAVAEAGSCSIDSLKKARAAGVSALKLRKRGCSAAALKAAGFTAAELRGAGFSAAELRAAGFSAKDLKAAGFSASELKAAGFSAKDLKAAGFSAKDLKDAGFSASELNSAGFSPEDLKSAGFKEEEIRDAEMKSMKGLGVDLTSLQEELAKLKAEKVTGMDEQERDDFIRQQQAIMRMQANQLFAAWTPVPVQTFVQGQSPEKVADVHAVMTPEEQSAMELKNSDIYKAGKILFAVLDTGVNSDENSPVMATIVQGPLKGSKVLGNFQRVQKKVLLKFSVVSVPKLDTSIAINAVAVDPNTAKTALASKVDNHYFLRYGLLFASSFVSGLGQAFQNAGGQVTTSTTGSVVTMPALTFPQKAIVAFGNTANQFGRAMQSKVNTPPTITVNSGTSIGLLLMADLAVPKNTDKDSKQV